LPLRTWLSTVRVGFTLPSCDPLVAVHDSGALELEEDVAEDDAAEEDAAEEDDDESLVCPQSPTLRKNAPTPSSRALIRYGIHTRPRDDPPSSFRLEI
jgi:hypothetical protein